METMTTLDFMEFRNYLVPASGFQSLQFRLVEATLGIKSQHHMEVEKQFFTSRLSAEDKVRLEEAEKKISVLELLEVWLSRMPFSEFGGFDFWGGYSRAVETMLNQDKEIISTNPSLDDRTKGLELKNLEVTASSFHTLLDARAFEEQRQQGKIRLSQKVMLSAVFIYLYRDYPAWPLWVPLKTPAVCIDSRRFGTTFLRKT